MSALALLVATRKGLWILRPDAARQCVDLEGPHFLGHVLHHAVLDPRDRRTLLVAARTGHLGPTVFRSVDFGNSWTEATVPPAFPKAVEGGRARVVDHVFWLEPGHASETDCWYAGTSPEGLFRSEDGGKSWSSVTGFNDHPRNAEWTHQEDLGTPDGPILHSIQIDPRDLRHLYIAMSGWGGGVFESRDGGQDWKPINKGCAINFAPVPDPEFGHDPHCVRLHPLEPDLLYQQNHCGIYRMHRPDAHWVRIGDNMPKEIGDIGFPIELHPRDPKTAWVFPMDGTDVWPRTSPGGKPAVYVTRDAGESWQRLDRGLPREQAWFTVRRQAMALDARDPVGVYFGTTNGEVWGSANEGVDWRCLARHLPLVHSVEVAEFGA